MNGRAATDFASILRSMAGDVATSYGSAYLISAGIRGIKWEAGDEEIMCVQVMPKKPLPGGAESGSRG